MKHPGLAALVLDLACCLSARNVEATQEAPPLPVEKHCRCVKISLKPFHFHIGRHHIGKGFEVFRL